MARNHSNSSLARGMMASDMTDAVQIDIDFVEQHVGPMNPPAPEIPPAMDIAFQAAVMAAIEGVNGMVKEGLNSYDDYKEGKIGQVEYTNRVLDKGGKAAFRTGSRTAAALTLREGAKAVSNRLGSEFLKRFARSGAMSAICFGAVDQGIDTYKWQKGELTEQQYKISTVKNFGGTGGAIGGAAIGATLGSVVPAIGTALGAMIGGMLGAAGGAEGGQSLGESIFGVPPKATPDPDTKTDTESNSDESTDS
ncbi:MAG: hypothetical protein AAF206_09280 [Bacteroidota bacterium]